MNPRPLSRSDLNRATLDRQGLLQPFDAPVPEVVGRLAGLQAQHAVPPYIALWSRRAGHTIADLEGALTDRSAVKATVMRSTLHIVGAADYPAMDAASGEQGRRTWSPSARRAGLDLDELNDQVRAFCSEPRTVLEIEEHLAGLHPRHDVAAAVPAGVRNPWFRLATACGGLVHVPPSGLWREHGKPTYLSAEAWLGEVIHPSPEKALERLVERYLAAYGPASLEDILKWSGQQRKTAVRTAVETLGDRLVHHTSADGADLLDLAGLTVPEDAPVPPRFLARWDSALIAYADRERILPADHREAVAKKNGDFLPTFLIDGFVGGLWSLTREAGRAVLTLQPFGRVSRADRTTLEELGEDLARFAEPDAGSAQVRWVRG